MKNYNVERKFTEILMCMYFFLHISSFPIKKIDGPFWHPCLWDWVGLTRLRHHAYGGKEIEIEI